MPGCGAEPQPRCRTLSDASRRPLRHTQLGKNKDARRGREPASCLQRTPLRTPLRPSCNSLPCRVPAWLHAGTRHSLAKGQRSHARCEKRIYKRREAAFDIHFYLVLDGPSGHLEVDRRDAATGVCASDASMHNLAFCIEAGALPHTLARRLRRRERASALRISAVGGLCLTVPKNSLII